VLRLGLQLGAALLATPMAYADDVATLPIPPFDPNTTFLVPPGIGGDWTNVEEIKPEFEVQYDQTYTLPDGSYEIHGVQDPYNAPRRSRGSSTVLHRSSAAKGWPRRWARNGLARLFRYPLGASSTAYLKIRA
jgi:hypothetical protein